MGGILSGKWLSITQYAEKHGLSISTVRRYIKANRFEFRKENGKFLIKDECSLDSERISFESFTSKLLEENVILKKRIETLERKIEMLNKKNL